MNRTAIEWTEYTWNPITGCRHGCPFCYARKIARRFPANFPNGFEPTFHEDRLQEPYKLNKPAKIFTVSMGDMFGDWVPQKWIDSIFETMEGACENTYQILTKNPKKILPALYGDTFSRFGDMDALGNVWLGTSVNDKAATPRSEELAKLKGKSPRWTSFVSFEPLLEAMPDLDLSEIDWVIIGAQTNPRKNPETEWVQHIIDQAKDQDCKIFLKDTIQEWWPERLREFPK